MRENLFSSLESEITIALLFLRNVRRIRIEELNQSNQVALRWEVNRRTDGDSTVIVDHNKQETKFLIHTLQAAELNSETERSELEKLAKDLKVPSVASVAACLSRTDEEERFHDRVSVMLPLPILPSTRTGLPVIVNTFFALGESRLDTFHIDNH